MARWSRSRLRIFGVVAVAFLGGSLLVLPAVSQAEEQPAAPARAAGREADRLTVNPRAGGRSAFRFSPASGDSRAPYAFVSTGGTVRAQALGKPSATVVQAKSGAPARAAQARAAATTYKTTLTVKSENWTAWNKSLNLWNRDTWTYVPVTNPSNSLSATVNLPPGNYYVAVMYGIYNVDSYMLTKSFTVKDKAQTVTLAESSAKEVAIKVDDTSARQDGSAVWMSLPNGDLMGFAGGYKVRTYVTTASTPGTTLRVHEVLTKSGSSAAKPTPYRYDLMKSWAHPLPASPITTVKTSSLAKTTITVRAPGTTTPGSYQTVPMTGEWTGAYIATSMRLPATFTEYVTPGVTMSRLISYGDSQNLYLRDRNLPAGTYAAETVGAGPLVPSRRSYGDDSRRDYNRLQLLENMTLGDAAGNLGAASSSTTSMRLSSGREVLKESTDGSLVVDVPSARQTYLLEQTSTQRATGTRLSTEVTSEWTFASGGPAYGILPLMDLKVGASGLDQRNRAGSAPVGLTVVPSTRESAAAGTVDRLEWSADDGRTWTELPLTASGAGVAASLTVPTTAAYVSLRISARNDEGGALRRTVLRAIAGPAVPGDESAGGTTISNVKVNGGKGLSIGTSGEVQFTATFTASDPSGIADAGFYLWHGNFNAPDGIELAGTECVPVNPTTSTCTATVYIWDVRFSLASNALAGGWRAAAWATAKDGIGFTDRHGAGSVALKRATRLTANATPEPVKKSKTVTVTGAFTRADWSAGGFKPYASQPVSLAWAKVNTSTWSTVKTFKSDSAGNLKTTATAGSDGSYRFSFASDSVSAVSNSPADYVDVQ
ncbi:hypothetical protein [Actinoplanes sp. NPDC049316]|uniref:hypothetical protein n=1 Tax=Actinoplanes sp. NPDC049316 TaxID=3154727 RepID=UPI003412F85D